MIMHILASLPTPKGPHSVPVNQQQITRENRDIYSFSFVIGCAWLTCLFFFKGFREIHKVIPGGVLTSVIICLGIIGTSAFLLR